MLKIDFLKELLLISITLSTITCTLVQKTKFIFKTSKYISLYSLIINIIIGIIFSYTFTSIRLPNCLWIGFFSFLGADSIYKSLEGTISSYSEIVRKEKIELKDENIINKEDK
jgi:hypothetical protein